jgi:hypothetical protein
MRAASRCLSPRPLGVTTVSPPAAGLTMVAFLPGGPTGEPEVRHVGLTATMRLRERNPLVVVEPFLPWMGPWCVLTNQRRHETCYRSG